MATLLAPLFVFFGWSDGVRPAGLAAIFAASWAFAYVGARILRRMAGTPFFERRVQYTVGLFLVVGPGLGAVYVIGTGSTTPANTAILVVLGELALFEVIWFSNSPQRRGGWLARLTARRFGGSLCPRCGMPARPSADTTLCPFCGASLDAI